MRAPDSLRGIIQERLRHYSLEKGVKAAQSLGLWERVAGPAVAEVTQANDVRDGVLWVHTRSSVWSQELSLMKETLIAKLNAELGAETISDIRFRVKRLPKRRPEDSAVPEPPRELTEDEQRSLRALAERLGADHAARIARVAEKQTRAQAAGRACPSCGGPLHGEEATCPFCRQAAEEAASKAAREAAIEAARESAAGAEEEER